MVLWCVVERENRKIGKIIYQAVGSVVCTGCNRRGNKYTIIDTTVFVTTIFDITVLDTTVFDTTIFSPEIDFTIFANTIFANTVFVNTIFYIEVCESAVTWQDYN
jgi:hypothetical protein